MNYYGQQPNQYPYQAGYGYANQPMPKMSQPLSKADINELRSQGSAFSLSVDPIDLKRSICTHKENGTITLRENGDGSVTCSICGETFELADMTEEQVSEAVNIITNLLQSIKTYFLDIPDEMAKQYFQMIPLLKKMPKLFTIAANNFNRYSVQGLHQPVYQQTGFNLFNAINGGYGMPQQGGYMNPQPQTYGVPQGQQFGYGQQPQGYGYPQGYPMPQGQFGGYPQGGMMPQGQPGYNPFTNTMDVAPQQPQVQSATQQPAESGDRAVNTKTYNV